MCATTSCPFGSANRGVTLIELIIAMAILAVLIAVAAPSFREVATNNRSSGIVNTFLADISMARSEATKHARPVSVVATGADWNSGWQVFVDNNGNGVLDVGDEELKRAGSVNEGYLSNVFNFTGNVARISYGAMGQLVFPDAAADFRLCRPDGDAAKSSGVRVELSGRAQSYKSVEGC